MELTRGDRERRRPRKLEVQLGDIVGDSGLVVDGVAVVGTLYERAVRHGIPPVWPPLEASEAVHDSPKVGDVSRVAVCVPAAGGDDVQWPHGGPWSRGW